MPGVGGGCAVTAGQIGRRRSVFQQRFEYGVWTTRYGKHSIEDYYRSGGGFHAHRLDAITAGGNGEPFGVAVKCTGSDAHTAAVAGGQLNSSSVAGDFTRFTSRIASRFAEVSRKAGSPK